MRITLTEHVDADPETVFEIYSDVSRAAERASGIEAVQILTDGPVGKGTRFRETRVMFGKPATEELEFTDFQPPRSYTVECESCGAHFASVFTFEPEQGGTRVSMQMHSRPLTMKARLLSPMGLLFAGSMKKLIRQDILDLKRVAEGDTAATPSGA